MERPLFSGLCSYVASACLSLVACGDKSEATLPSIANAASGGATSEAPKAEPNSTSAGRDAAGAASQSRSDVAGSSGAQPPGSAGASGSTMLVAGMGGADDVDDAGTHDAGMQDAGMQDAGAQDAGGQTTTREVAPDGWPLATPADFGIDASQLDELGDALQAASGRTRAGLVVVKEGALIYEKYWDGDAASTHLVFSCTKSWGSTLVGIAARQGLITVDDPVTKWVPEPAREVGSGAVIKNLLTQTAHTTPPGTSFAYNSGSIINTLPEILEAASGISSHAFFQKFLADPLQLTMMWPTCPAGGCAGTRYKADYIQFGDQGPNAVLTSTIRDQAKLGWLWLDDGMWKGERLLDSSYIQAATQPSFDFQAVYGYLWWLNREGRSSILSFDSQVPDDMYHAVGGIGNCSIAVLPTQRMVIAHVGELDSGGLGGHWDVFAPLFKP
jgi:CubicO group peptidase (beta-lactamase class C family)